MPVPPVKAARPINIPTVLEGAVALLIMADRLQKVCDTNPKAASVSVKRNELVATAKVNRMAAHMVDDLAYMIEKQEEKIAALQQLVEMLRGK